MLGELEGRGWLVVDPPEDEDEDSAVARYDGEVLKAGFLLDIVEDTDDTYHTIYRSGSYDLEVKIDFDIGRGQVRVTKAEGYDA